MALENDIVLPSKSNPALTAELALEIEALAKDIENLSPAQREVILLRFGAELSTAEVANLLAKSTGTVKALQHNAIVALRKMSSSDK